MKTKRIPKRVKTQYSRNKGIIGDSIEVMMERLMDGEGIDGVEERDLVYNDGEGAVNPITNIRSDKNELMLEEKIGEQKYNHKKSEKIKEEKEAKEAKEAENAEE